MQQLKSLNGLFLKKEDIFAAHKEKTIWQTLRSVRSREWMGEWETQKQRLSV
jgi:hypothetical protein